MTISPRVLGQATSVISLVLTAVAVVGASHQGHARTGAILGALFVVVYLAGAVSPRRFQESWIRPKLEGADRAWAIVWLLALTLLWVALVLVTSTAAWLAFPLILLQLGVLGLSWGVVWAFLTAGASSVVALSRVPPGESPIGALLGPLLGSVVAVAFMIGAITVSRESRSRQVALDQLQMTRSLLADAEEARVVSRERQRLARELHDTVSQGLSAVSMLLGAALRAGDQEHADAKLVRQALEATKGNLEEARRISTSLAPFELEEQRLPAALRTLGEQTRLADGQEGPHVSVSVEMEGWDLDLTEEVALLRTVQSAIWNAQEHAQASTISVLVHGADQELVLRVVDDGQGFITKVPEPGRGTGIPAMHSRMEEIGGRLTIKTDQAGTEVTAVLPRKETTEENG